MINIAVASVPTASRRRVARARGGALGRLSPVAGGAGVHKHIVD